MIFLIVDYESSSFLPWHRILLYLEWNDSLCATSVDFDPDGLEAHSRYKFLGSKLGFKGMPTSLLFF